jgi:hypothetical protein
LLLSDPLIKHEVILQVPSVEPEAHTLPDIGSNLTLTTDDLCRGFFPPKDFPIQKLLAAEKFAINTFPEAAPTTNLVPSWFQAASIFALDS